MIMETWEIKEVAEKAWLETWMWDDAPVYPGTFAQFRALKERFLENLERRLALAADEHARKQSIRAQGGNMVTAEEIDVAMASIEEDLHDAGLEYGPDGELVQVHTPWACGFVKKEEYIVDF